MMASKSGTNGPSTSWRSRAAQWLFAAFLILTLTTPAWRVGLFTWLPLARLPMLAGRPVQIGLLSLLPVALVTCWAGARLLDRRARPWQWGWLGVSLPLAILSLLTLLGLEPATTWRTVVQVVGLGLAWLAYLFVVNERSEASITWAAAIVILVQGTVALGQFWLQRDLGLAALGEPALAPIRPGLSVIAGYGHHWLRAYGLTAHPNLLGGILCVLLLVLLPQIARRQGWRRALLATIFAVGLLALLASFSRGAWLGFLIGLALLTWPRVQAALRGRRRFAAPGRNHLVYLLPALAAVIFAAAYSQLIAGRFFGLDNPLEATSIAERLRNAVLAAQVIAAHPLWGVGAGNYLAAVGGLDTSALAVHNIPLLAAAELGLAGAFLVLWLAAGPFLSWRAADTGTRGNGDEATAARPGPSLEASTARLAPWAALVTIGLVDTTLWLTTSWRAALIFGLLAAYATNPGAGRPSRQALARWLERAAAAALLLLAAGLSFEWIKPLVALGNLAVLTTVEAAVLLVLGLWLAALLAGRRRPHLPTGLALPLVLWLLVLTLSALLAPAHRLDALKFLARLLNAIVVGWAAYDLVLADRQRPQRWLLTSKALALGGFAVALIGLAEIAGVSPLLTWLEGFRLAPTLVGDTVRLSATLGYATTAAMILELTLPLGLAWLLTARPGWRRLLLALAVGAGLAALALTLTRAAVIGMVAALVVMALIGWRLRQPGLVRAGAGAGLALGVLVAVILIANPVARLRLKSESQAQWYRVAYQVPADLAAEAGQSLLVPISVTNNGVRTWLAGGEEPFALSYHLLDAEGESWHFDGARTSLPLDIAPGTTVALDALVQAPATPGTYQVAWDMVHEEVTWFSWEGSPSGRSLLAVSPPSGRPLPDPFELRRAGPAEDAVIKPVGRLTLWRTALAMLADRPLLGVGPDNFRHLYGPYAGTTRWDRRVHANNLYVEWLADTGVLGLAALLWLSVALVARAVRNLPARNPGAGPETYAIWQAALLASLAAWFVHGLLDQFYEFTPTLVAFWLIAALAVAAVGKDEAGLDS